MDWRGSGMKRTNSDEALSSMTGDVDARGQIYPAKIQEQIVWTNEKHNLYIESLEASFVQQLHQSIGLSCRNLPDQLFPNSCDSSDKSQFTVLQDGCRKMLQPKSKLQMGTTSSNIRVKPHVHNFRFSRKHYESSHSGRKKISCSEQRAAYYGSYQNSGSGAEFSDQNFIDEQDVSNISSNEWQKKNTSDHAASKD
ncbi:unnamed protein product [Rhodiola kirilowii]